MKNTIEEIEQAKQLLKANGYFTGNLWRIEDVQLRYPCDEETAQDILDGALTNEATVEQVFLAISMVAQEQYNLTKIDN